MDETFTQNNIELTLDEEWRENIHRAFQAERQQPLAASLKKLFRFAAAYESVKSNLIGTMEIMKN